MRLELAKRTDLALRAMQELCSCGDRLSGSELAETLETTHQYLPHKVGRDTIFHGKEYPSRLILPVID